MIVLHCARCLSTERLETLNRAPEVLSEGWTLSMNDTTLCPDCSHVITEPYAAIMEAASVPELRAALRDFALREAPVEGQRLLYLLAEPLMAAMIGRDNRTRRVTAVRVKRQIATRLDLY